MLNIDKVLRYIKSNLGFPVLKIELSDEVMTEYIREFIIPEFSKYIPDINRVKLNLATALCVENTENEYYLEDPDGLEILSVKEIYFSSSGELMFGHPFMGAWDLNTLQDMALNVEISQMIKQFSSFNYTFEFRHPNKLRISPINSLGSSVLVEYERLHPSDLSTIKNEYQNLFMDLCLAEMMIQLGRIRMKYQNMKTPFGEIPLDTSIFQEGQDKKKEIVERMQQASYPNVIVQFG